MLRSKYFTSHDKQNEILELLAHDIKESPYFAIVADETTDCSKNEQVSICLRYVNDLQPFEDFIGMYEKANTAGEALIKAVSFKIF